MSNNSLESYDEAEHVIKHEENHNLPVNALGVDTVLFDYGGVVGTNRVEPYWSRMAELLGSHPKEANKYLSETSPHGIAFRLGKIDTEEFWGEVQHLAGVTGRDCRELMTNWAQSYAIDPRMVDISTTLNSRGYQTGILMNSDAERFKYIEEIYRISQYYRFVIASNTHFITKPEPEAYEVAKQVVNRSNDPHKMLYIDDRKSNADAAVQCGLQGCTFEGYQQFVDWLVSNGFLDEQDLCPWKNELYRKEQELIRTFFGHDLPMRPLPAEITKEQIDKWAELQMGLHYLPNIDLDRKNNYPGWKHKPYEWFYERIEAGDVLETSENETLARIGRPMNLGGKWVLIDERIKPQDKNGIPYPDDFLAPIIEECRINGALEKNNALDMGTRFFVSWTEFDEVLRPAIAKALEVKIEQVRLPRVVEYNYFGNTLHPDWGETDTWEWLQEACGGGKYRMRGGHSFAGGLSIVYWRGAAGHGTDRGFRPLIDLGPNT